MFDALAAVLRRPERVTDWRAAIDHAERLAASHAPGSGRLVEMLRLLQRLAQGSAAQRLHVAAELEDGAAFLRGG